MDPPKVIWRIRKAEENNPTKRYGYLYRNGPLLKKAEFQARELNQTRFLAMPPSNVKEKLDANIFSQWNIDIKNRGHSKKTANPPATNVQPLENNNIAIVNNLEAIETLKQEIKTDFDGLVETIKQEEPSCSNDSTQNKYVYKVQENPYNQFAPLKMQNSPAPSLAKKPRLITQSYTKPFIPKNAYNDLLEENNSLKSCLSKFQGSRTDEDWTTITSLSSKCADLQSRLDKAAMLMEKLMTSNSEKDKEITRLERKLRPPTFSVPYYKLKKSHRKERLKTVIEKFGHIRASNTEEEKIASNRMILDDLGAVFGHETRRLTPEEDLKVFHDNGIAWWKRTIIKRLMRSFGKDVLAPTKRAFEYSKERREKEEEKPIDAVENLDNIQEIYSEEEEDDDDIPFIVEDGSTKS